MRWRDCRLVAFDTETTGLSPFDGDRVVEFGAVELQVSRGGQVTRTTPHQWFINPERPIPRAASKISGITDDDVADAPTFDQLATRISAVLQDAVIIAHNLPFDLNFMRVEFGRVGASFPPVRAEVDTLPLAQRLMPELRSHKLESICIALSVPLDNAHRASHDAEACGRALVEISRRHGAPDDFDAFVDWAEAISAPPDSAHLKIGRDGVPEFADGPFAGKSIEQHPDHLQWMLHALERRDDRWIPRFPESLRTWARRWLRVRGSGIARTNPRSQGHLDWCLDPPVWRELGDRA